jgi:hypothetical protein
MHGLVEWRRPGLDAEVVYRAPMTTVPSRTIEADKVLILSALGLLISLGWITGVPIFEPFGRGRLTYFTVLGLPLLALLLLVRRSQWRLRGFLGSWWPVIGIVAVYESLKHMHANRITEWLGIPPRDDLMLKVDQLLFGKALPLWMDSWTAPWFQSTMTFLYIWVYYLGPLLLLGYAYLSGRERLFRRLRLGLVLGLLGGYILYLLVPVAGPKFLIGDQFQHPIPSHSRLETLVFDTMRFNWDCFPSLHTAIPWLLTVLVWRRLPGWIVAIGAILSSGVTLSTVALRLHYGVDLIAAFAWVGAVWWAVEKLCRYDYGRFRVAATPTRRRPQAATSDGRRALSRLSWSVMLTSAACMSSLIAFERWASVWIAVPVRSSAGVIAGLCSGLMLGRLGVRLLDRKVGPSMKMVGASALATALWLALLGARAMPFSLAGWSARSFAELGAPASGLLGALIAGAWVLPLGFLLGLNLGTAGCVLSRVGLARAWSVVARWAVTGTFAGLVLARYLLHPALGFGDSVLLAALVTAAAAWLCHRAPRMGHARHVASPRNDRKVDVAVALVGGASAGALLPVWTFLYPTAFSGSLGAFETVVMGSVAGALLAELLAGRTYSGVPSARLDSAWWIFLAAVTLAGTSSLWTRVPELLRAAEGTVATATAAERFRLLALLVLLIPPSALLWLSIRSPRRVSKGTAGAESPVSFVLAAAIGGASTALLALPSLGSRAFLTVLWSAVALTGLVGMLVKTAGRRRPAVALLAILPAMALLLQSRDDSFELRLRTMSIPGKPFPGSAVFLGEDSAVGGAAVYRLDTSKEHDRVLIGNGRLYASTIDRAAEASAALAVRHSRAPHRTLLLAPSRTTALALDRLDVESVHLVGPSEALLTASKLLAPSPLPARTELVVASPRGFLAAGDPFDIVISHIEDLRVGISGGELNRDFYQLAHDRMVSTGAMVQALRLATVDLKELLTATATAATVFPHVSVWLVDGHALLVATFRPQRLESGNGPEVQSLPTPDQPVLSPHQVGFWLRAAAPPTSSDRSGRLELHHHTLDSRDDLTQDTTSALLHFAGLD